jgi:hypothetical protein
VFLFGSLILMPAIVIITGVGYVATFGGRSIYYVVPAVLVVVVPLVLEVAGVIAPSYRFEDGVLVVLPGMTALPPTPTLLFLAVSHVVVIVGSLGYVWRLRTNHVETERRLHLQVWQLAALAPKVS